MLQKIHDSIGRWIAGVILGLLAITFIFWGVDFTLMGSGFAAKVNGEDIPLAEFERELQAEQNQYQEFYRVELDDDMRRQLRRNVIERMVANEALKQRVAGSGYRISDERLADFIRGMPLFQIDGNFSMQLFNARLANEGLSPDLFWQMQREQLAMLDLQRGVAASTFLTPAEFRRYIELYNQRRDTAYALFAAESFLDGVTVSDEELPAYYDATRHRYMTEETVDIEYLELAQSDLAADVEVSEEDVRDYYESQRERFVTEEERRARHILLSEDTEATRALAGSLVERLEAGEDFAALAAEYSQDPGTSGQGGDLGWISRGMFGDAFEDALYEMQLGEVRGPVATEFGLHVIKLEDLRAGEVRAFESVADELREELRTLRSEELFYDRANELADRAFDAIDELAPVADALGLELQRREGFPRSGDRLLFPNSPPVVQAAFDPDALERRENSDLIELAEDHVMVLRVIAHHPSELQPLDTVREQVESDLRRNRAEAAAAAAAAAFLAALQEDSGLLAGAAETPPESAEPPAAEGSEAPSSEPEETDAAESPAGPLARLAAEHGGTWAERAWLERTNGNVPSEILATVFGLPPPVDQPRAEHLPLANGDHAVVLLFGVEPGAPDAIPQEQRDLRQRQLADQAAAAELAAYVGNVRDGATVRVPDEVLQPAF